MSRLLGLDCGLCCRPCALHDLRAGKRIRPFAYKWTVTRTLQMHRAIVDGVPRRISQFYRFDGSPSSESRACQCYAAA